MLCCFRSPLELNTRQADASATELSEFSVRSLLQNLGLVGKRRTDLQLCDRNLCMYNNALSHLSAVRCSYEKCVDPPSRDSARSGTAATYLRESERWRPCRCHASRMPAHGLAPGHAHTLGPRIRLLTGSSGEHGSVTRVSRPLGSLG